jgi:hypothetical protein
LARGAGERAANYQVELGGDYQCPTAGSSGPPGRPFILSPVERRLTCSGALTGTNIGSPIKKPGHRAGLLTFGFKRR